MPDPNLRRFQLLPWWDYCGPILLPVCVLALLALGTRTPLLIASVLIGAAHWAWDVRGKRYWQIQAAAAMQQRDEAHRELGRCARLVKREAPQPPKASTP